MTAFLLPVDVLSLICAFLSSPQEILHCISHLNRSITEQLKPACFSQQHLAVSEYCELVALVDTLSSPRNHCGPASYPNTAARIGAVHSLAIVFHTADQDSSLYDEVLERLFVLMNPQPASSSAFSSAAHTSAALFTTLSHLCIRCHPRPPLQLTRQSLFRLLSSPSTPLISLTSLDVELDDISADPTLTSLYSLQHLRHVRFAGSSFPSYPPALLRVLSALWSLPHLELLDLHDLDLHGLPADAVLAAFVQHPLPASSTVRYLKLPQFNLDNGEINRVAALSDQLVGVLTRTAVQLESFTGGLMLSADSLSALMSLPSLRVLDVKASEVGLLHLGEVLEAMLATDAPHPPFVTVIFPIVDWDGHSEETLETVTALLPRFLSRLTELRHLSLPQMLMDDEHYIQSSTESLQQLQSLELVGGMSIPLLELHAPLTWPCMLQITLHDIEVRDECLAVLLAASPQLLCLRLQACLLESWGVVRLAAVHCPQLRQLSVSDFVNPNHIRARPVAQPPVHLPLPTVFLPHLAVLSLCQRPDEDSEPLLFSDLRPLIHPNNRCLHSVELIGSALTAANILSLSVLPCLSRLAVSDESARVLLPEVEAAGTAARSHHFTALRRHSTSERHAAHLRSVLAPPAGLEQLAWLDVWDAAATARRFSERAEEGSAYNLLNVAGVDALVVRPVFFQALQAEVSHSSHGGTQVGILQEVDDSEWNAVGFD